MNDGAQTAQPGLKQVPFGRRLLGSTSLLRAFVELPTLTRGAKLCYLVMCAYGRDSGRCFMSARTLAHDLCSSVRQIARWWRVLERAGLIRPEWRAGRPTHYSFLPHPIFERAGKLPPDSGVTPPPTRVSPTPDTSVTQGIGSRYRTERSSSPTTSLRQQVTAEIWGYMQGEHPRQVDAPDRQIVDKCMAALHGHGIQDLRTVLRQRFRSGHGPGMAGGPRSYAWFVRVIENAFGRHE